MKKIAFLLGVVASALVLASCATKDTAADQTVVPQTTTAPAHHGHHDYKGEVK